VEVDVEAVPPTRCRLRGGQGDADPDAAPLSDEVKERAPAAAQVEHAPAGPDPDLLGDVRVLAPLSLFQAQREVTVVLGSAEVGELSQAEPEDAIDQRIGELEVVAVGHRPNGDRPRRRASAKVTSRPRSSSQSLRRTARRPSHRDSVGTSWKIGFSS
jgi:hypothetical protein